MGPTRRRVAHRPADTPKLLTAAEVADRCGVSLRSVRRWLAAGNLVGHRLGRAVRVAEPDLMRFLASCRNTEK